VTIMVQGLPIKTYNGNLLGQQAMVNPRVLIKKSHPLFKATDKKLVINGVKQNQAGVHQVMLKADNSPLVFTVDADTVLLQPTTAQDKQRLTLENAFLGKSHVTPIEQMKNFLKYNFNRPSYIRSMMAPTKNRTVINKLNALLHQKALPFVQPPLLRQRKSAEKLFQRSDKLFLEWIFHEKSTIE
jgi:hypothetical protein